MDDLLRLGGFPEPFLSGSERTARRWSREYRTLLVREEIGSLEQIVDLGNLELLALRLPELVGAPLTSNRTPKGEIWTCATSATWTVVRSTSW